MLTPFSIYRVPSRRGSEPLPYFYLFEIAFFFFEKMKFTHEPIIWLMGKIKPCAMELKTVCHGAKTVCHGAKLKFACHGGNILLKYNNFFVDSVCV